MENIGKDLYRFAHAFLTNEFARFAPKLYNNLRRHTGRGDGPATPCETADYFLSCFNDYAEQLGYERSQFKTYLHGKTVLEYGPGDVLGIALLMYAHGAASVHCIDRFELNRASARNIEIYREMLGRLGPDEQTRAAQAFNVHGDPGSGFNVLAVKYLVAENGLVQEREAYDLIISRSVLEHVNRLEMTIDDMARALKPDGVSVHKVDLKSHNQDRYATYDFLTWPEPVYQLMNSHKGRPNRWRVGKYIECLEQSGLRLRNLTDTGRLENEDIERIRPKLAKRFRQLTTEELTWLGFWMVLERSSSVATEPRNS